MGGSAPSNTTQQTLLDPQIKAKLLGNVNMADLITQGMLPNSGGGYYNPGSTAPGARQSPYAGGTISTDAGGMPTYNPGSDTGPVLNADGTPYVPPKSFTADFDPAQVEVQTALTNWLHDPSTTPTMQDFGSDTWQQLQNFQAPEVQAHKFTDLDFSKYLMPGQENVIDPLKNYFNEMGDRAVASKIGTGAMGSAVRGSNDPLRESQVRGEVALQSSPALANAYQQLFSTSAGLATGDLDRMQQSDLANATMKMQSPLINAQGATGMTNAYNSVRSTGLQNLNLLSSVGEERRGLQQARLDDPIKALQLRQGALNPALGATGGSATTATGGGTSPLAGALGGAAGAAGIAGMSGMFGTAGGAGVAAAAASPWLWPLIGGGALLGALS